MLERMQKALRTVQPPEQQMVTINLQAKTAAKIKLPMQHQMPVLQEEMLQPPLEATQVDKILIRRFAKRRKRYKQSLR